MSEKFPSTEKLKSKILIDRLFTEGKSIQNYPIKLIFTSILHPDILTHKTGVSVPKRNFKKAVDRNYLKRLMREAFRKNKYLVDNNLEHKFALMFIYTGREKLDYGAILKSIKGILEKLKEREGKDEKNSN